MMCVHPYKFVDSLTRGLSILLVFPTKTYFDSLSFFFYFINFFYYLFFFLICWYRNLINNLKSFQNQAFGDISFLFCKACAATLVILVWLFNLFCLFVFEIVSCCTSQAVLKFKCLSDLPKTASSISNTIASTILTYFLFVHFLSVCILHLFKLALFFIHKSLGSRLLKFQIKICLFSLCCRCLVWLNCMSRNTL